MLVKKKILLIIILCFIILTPIRIYSVVFSGKLIDNNNNLLSEVAVKIINLNKIKMTDKFGKFIFNNLPQTNITVRFFKFGYNILTVKINLINQTHINKTIKLIPEKSIYLNEIKVKSKKSIIQGSKNVLRKKDLKNTSVSLFNDTMNAIKKLPGVAGSEFSGLLYIRGGTPFENISLMDDIIILNPYQWGGRTTIFNSEMVDKVEVYTGGFPAKYGNAMSGIIDIKNKKGNFKKIKGFIDISAATAELELDGPINLFQNSSFIISGRRTFYDFIMNAFSNDTGNIFPFFQNIHLKLYFIINSYNIILCNSMYVEDGMEWTFTKEQSEQMRVIEEGDKFKYNSKKFINNIQWKHIFNKDFYMKNTFSYIRLDMDNTMLSTSLPGNTYVSENEFQFKSDFIYDIDKYNKINLGYLGVLVNADVNYEWRFKHTKITGVIETNISKLNFNGNIIYNGIYLQDEINIIKDDFTISAGIRYNSMDVINKSAIAYRTGIQKKIINDLFLNLYYGIYYEFPLNIVMYDEENGNKSLRPSYSKHYIFELESYPFKNILFKNTIFYKKYNDLINDDPNRNYINGEIGESYGFESIIQKSHSAGGKFDGWIAYTYLVSRRKITERSEPYDEYTESNIVINKWFYPEFDQRHTISVVLTYNPTEKWELYLDWEFHTGQPYTLIKGGYKIVNTDGDIVYLPIKSGYNEARLPSYQRLDLKVSYKFKFFGLNSESYIQFINLYNNKNIQSYYYNEDYTEKREAKFFPFMFIGGIKVKF